jgi:hypothetical protein
VIIECNVLVAIGIILRHAAQILALGMDMEAMDWKNVFVSSPRAFDIQPNSSNLGKASHANHVLEIVLHNVSIARNMANNSH